jgi:hypothetical protein
MQAQFLEGVEHGFNILRWNTETMKFQTGFTGFSGFTSIPQILKNPVIPVYFQRILAEKRRRTLENKNGSSQFICDDPIRPNRSLLMES